VESERDFFLPGSANKIDLYIAQLPRAAVIFRTFQNQESLDAALIQAEALHAAYRAELGETCQTICLVCGPGGCLEKSPIEIADGLLCIHIGEEPHDLKAADEAGAEIKASLDGWRTTYASILKGAVYAVPIASAVLPFLGIFGGAAAGILGAIVIGKMLGPGLGKDANDSLALETEKNGSPTNQTTQNTSFLRHDTPFREALSAAPPPSQEGVRIVESQARNILETFRELVPETYRVLSHEMQFLVDEFRLGHFTACAMRGGRSLEAMVYELSRRWDVEVQDSTFGQLEELRRSLDRIEDLIGDYQVSAGPARKKLGMSLDQTFHALNTSVMSLALTTKSDQQLEPTRSGCAPRPVEALLKKIQKRHGHLEGVSEHFKAILSRHPESGSLIRRILDIRNRAAHADVNGKTQEIDEASVRRLIDDINVMLLRLSNVGIAIQKDKTMGQGPSADALPGGVAA